MRKNIKSSWYKNENYLNINITRVQISVSCSRNVDTPAAQKLPSIYISDIFAFLTKIKKPNFVYIRIYIYKVL